MATVAQRLQADRERFPSLLPGEIVILKAWLRIHEREYDRFDYDVHVGPGEDPGPTFEQNLRDMWIHNTQLRIDVVAYIGPDPTLIEVKDDAAHDAVGQLLGYRRHWRDEQRSVTDPKLIIVCRTFAKAILPTVAELGIRLDQVKVPSAEMRAALGLQRFGTKKPG